MQLREVESSHIIWYCQYVTHQSMWLSNFIFDEFLYPELIKMCKHQRYREELRWKNLKKCVKWHMRIINICDHYNEHNLWKEMWFKVAVYCNNKCQSVKHYYQSGKSIRSGIFNLVVLRHKQPDIFIRSFTLNTPLKFHSCILSLNTINLKELTSWLLWQCVIITATASTSQSDWPSSIYIRLIWYFWCWITVDSSG